MVLNGKCSCDEIPGSEQHEDDNSLLLKHNLLCLQIFGETQDYVLEVKPETGMCMFANRNLSADEVIFQSPVAPSECKSLFRAPMTPERQSFAERFLEWQENYGNINSVGASSDHYPRFTLQDFEHCDDSHDPCPDWPDNKQHFSFELTIEPQDYILVEFVGGNLPPERRFEVLPYGEGIYWSGEPDYSPEKCRRPPSLVEDDRTIEIPGHFSNHACGDSATAYDTYRLSREGESEQPLVAPALSPGGKAKLSKLSTTGELPEPEYNVMMSARALLKGDEILTNYAFWHWSNEDQFEGSETRKTPYGYFDDHDWEDLPINVQYAARLLGYTPEIWKTDNKPSKKLWKELTQAQQAAASLLGESITTWDDDGETESDATAYDNKSWHKLPDEIRSAYEALGYNKKIWNSDGETKATKKSWPLLSIEEQKAAKTIGFSPKLWDDDDDDDDDGDGFYDECEWDDLPVEVRTAAEVLGYTEELWDSDQEPEIAESSWDELTPEQLAAARIMNFSRLSWDGYDEPWFHCLCGDSKCHSAKGFQGVKTWPEGEQKRLYWLFSPWIRQNLDWKKYNQK